MGAVPLIALAAVGTGLDIYGRISAASAQEDAAQKEAQLKNLQADELLSREAMNENILRERGAEIQSRYVAQNAASGGGGGGLGGVLRLKRDLDNDLMISRREADFKASQIRAGASIESDLSSSLLSSAYIGAAGTLFNSAARTYSILSPPSAADKLVPKKGGK